ALAQAGTPDSMVPFAGFAFWPALFFRTWIVGHGHSLTAKTRCLSAIGARCRCLAKTRKVLTSLRVSPPVPSSKTLREMRLLLLEEGHCFRDQALSFCNMQSPPPREVLDASSLSTLVQMVSAGLGVTLIPEMAVAVETRSASVSVTRFKKPQPSRTIGMIWRKTSPLARQLLEISEVVGLSAEALRKQHAT